jgi:hexosaminidase
MIFPRLCAIAETLWTPQEEKDFDDFSQRLAVHGKRLDALGINRYRGALR